MSDTDLIDRALDDIVDSALDVSDSASNDLVEAPDDIDHALDAVLAGKSPAVHLQRAKSDPEGTAKFEPNDVERAQAIEDVAGQISHIYQRTAELREYQDQVEAAYPELTLPAEQLVQLAADDPARYTEVKAISDYVYKAGYEAGQAMRQAFQYYGLLCDQEFDARYPNFDCKAAIETLTDVGVDESVAQHMYHNCGTFTLADKPAQDVLAMAACQRAGKNLIGDDEALGEFAVKAMYHVGFTPEHVAELLKGQPIPFRDFRIQSLVAEATLWHRRGKK